MITILPYVEINGVRTVNDEQLGEIWDRIVDDGSHLKLFEGDNLDTEKDFINFLKNPNIFPCFIFVDEEIQGMAWLSNVSDNHAFAHFCFLKSAWGKHTEEMGRETLKYWFSFPKGDGYLFDVLIGATPEKNRAAVNFIKKLGLNVIGTIPHIKYGVVSYITREEFHGQG